MLLNIEILEQYVRTLFAARTSAPLSMSRDTRPREPPSTATNSAVYPSLVRQGLSRVR